MTDERGSPNADWAAVERQLQPVLQQIDEALSIAILRERLAALDRGEPVIPAHQVFEDIRRELGLD